MNLVAQNSSAYLAGDDVIDLADPAVRALAAELRTGRPDDVAFAQAAYEHVRDEVRHSWDAQDRRVTVSASDVVREGVGLCFAKAHLLTALLRAEGVPAGLCYQRLTDDGDGHELHGLIAVYLQDGWHRQDPRGNTATVDAQFSLGEEQLAWPVRPELGERDYPEVFTAPSPVVLAALRGSGDALALCGGGLPWQL